MRMELVTLGARFDGEASRGAWDHMRCPLCNSRKALLGYNTRTHQFNCWQCGGHHPVTVLMALGAGREEAVRIWKEAGHGEHPAQPKQNRTGRYKPPKGVGALTRPHTRYLKQRGFDRHVARLWGIRGLGAHCGRLRWRLFIPIHFKGRPVSWTTRAIGRNVASRYISAEPEEEAISMKHVLYGEDLVPWGGSVIVHEGPVDCWTTGPGAVAVLGLNYDSQQVERLSHYARVTICFDATSAAQHRAEALAMEVMLAGCDNVQTYTLETGEDAPEADPDEVLALRELAGLEPA